MSAFIGIFFLGLWLTFGSALTSHFLQPINNRFRKILPAFVIAITLLFLFNFNLVVGAKYLFIAFELATSFMLFFAFKYVPKSDLKSGIKEIFGLLIIVFLALLFVFIVFKSGRFWVHEGPNHDSLVYFEGMHWALDWPLWVDSELVKSKWGLGQCAEASIWIGRDCSLYRGGTYTLAALAQFFSFTKAGVGLFGLFAYAGLFLWVAVSLFVDHSSKHIKYNTLIKIGLTMLLLFSTSILGALLNSNLATMLASASIAVAVTTCLIRDFDLEVRVVIVGLWVAVCTHLYAESLFYVGLIVFIAVAIEISQKRNQYSFKKIMSVMIAFVATLLIFANVTLLASINSLFAFKSISQGGVWPSWYIDAPQWAWMGSFVGGELQGAELSSLPIAGLGAVSSILAVLVLWKDRGLRAMLIAIAITSLLTIWFVEARAYRYGEHKILQLLGTTWCLLLAFSVLFCLHTESCQFKFKPFFLHKALSNIHRPFGIFILFCLLYIEGSFFVRGVKMMKSLEPSHGVHLGVDEALSAINAGDIVLIDDSRWVGVEKFQKTHYLAFLIHHRGARVVMPDLGGDTMRGGYTRSQLNNTLSKFPHPNWYLSGVPKSGREPIFLPKNLELVFKSTDFVLSRIGSKESGFVVPGDGWYDCELMQCGMSGSFAIEAVVPNTWGDNLLHVDANFSFPPAGSYLTVEVNGKWLKKVLPVSGVFTVRVSPGHNVIKVTPSWKLATSFEYPVTGDSRKPSVTVSGVSFDTIQN